MPKTLTLKHRQKIQEGIYAWSDGIVLQNACTMLSARKPPAQALVWGIIASKIELAMEAESIARNGHEPQPVEVELSNQEVAVLWKALMNDVPNEWYGRGQDGKPAPVSAGTLYLMHCDIAAQLSKTMPKPAIDEDDSGTD